MKIYRFVRNQKIPIDKNEAWKFLSDPNNLKTITPDYMGFDIIEKENTKMYSGQIIKYIVTPIFGIKMNWVTEITHVKDFEYFVDEQRFGPYKFWHHLHKFIEEEGKTKMIDEISFAYYGGFIGDLIQHSLITKRIKDIFKYRTKIISHLFQS